MWKNTVIIVAVVCLCLGVLQFVLYKRSQNAFQQQLKAYQNTASVFMPDPDVVAKRIQLKDTVINHYLTQVITDKKLIQSFNRRIDSLRKELAQVKMIHDTVQIVQIQDTLINVLTFENGKLRNIINNQDSIIVAQRYIINSKDTLIRIAQTNLLNNQQLAKKYKRQRNWSIVGNVAQGLVIGGLLLK